VVRIEPQFARLVLDVDDGFDRRARNLERAGADEVADLPARRNASASAAVSSSA